MTTPTPTPEAEPVCICGHPESQHFEDCCITEITGCSCGDFLTGEAAREQIDRLVRIVRETPATPTPDDAGLRQRIETALRDAAHVCGPDCPAPDETACHAAHPVQEAVSQDGVVTDVYGPIVALADVVLPLVTAERAAELDTVAEYLAGDPAITAAEMAVLLRERAGVLRARVITERTEQP